MENFNLFIVMIVVPLVLGLMSILAPKSLQRSYALVGSTAFLLVTILMGSEIFLADSPGASLLVEQKIEWFPTLGSHLLLRLDSFSIWFVLMNAIVAVMAFGLNGAWYRKSPRLFTFLGFANVAFLNGAFLSQDLIFFYLFYEAVFIPMIFMVGIWGESTKATAVFRFFLMSLAGSVLMLISIFSLVSLYHDVTQQYSSALPDLLTLVGTPGDRLTWCAAGFFLAFAIKVPMVPFHGWLRDVYVMAPMPATIWMSAVLSKLGIFGFLRFVCPLFPEAMTTAQPWILFAAAISVVYAAFLAIEAKNPKTLLAFSSISHLGFVLMGVFSLNPIGARAAILLSFAHAIVSAALFYFLTLIQNRRPNFDLTETMGLSRFFPVLSVLGFIAVLGGVALPGTVNFVGEFLVLLTAFPKSPYATALAGLGVVLGAVYLFRFFQSIGLGGGAEPMVDGDVRIQETRDIGLLDFSILGLALLIVLFLGFQPNWILNGIG